MIARLMRSSAALPRLTSVQYFSAKNNDYGMDDAVEPIRRGQKAPAQKSGFTPYAKKDAPNI
jgi:hypothetical protein